MKSIEDLLRNLARPDVLEFGLVTNRLPSINVGGRFEPVDDEAPSTDRVKQMLIAMGGGRFIETLSDRPVQWTTRLEGVGVIAVAAIMRKDIVQARFTVARREGAQRPSQGQPVAQAVQIPNPPPPKAAPGTAGAVRPAAGQPPPTFARTQQGTGAPQQPQPIPQPVAREQPQGQQAQKLSPVNPVLTKTMSSPPPPMTGASGVTKGASSGKQPVAPPAPAPPAPPPPAPAPPREGSATNEWDNDDDNEPTVQTISPQTPQNLPQPTAPTAAPAMDEPKPKPARRPEEVRSSPPVRPSSSDTVTTTTAAPPSPTQTHAVPLPPAREPSAAPPPNTEVGSSASSSDSLEEVDVEITTNDGGSLSASIDDDSEGIEHTVEVVPKKAEEAPESRPQPIPVAAKAESKSEPKLDAKASEPQPAAPSLDPKLVDPVLATKTDPRLEQKIDSKSLTGATSSVAHSAIPSTTPSGISAAPDKDRPRIDGAAALDSFLAMAVAAHATDLILVGGRPVLLRVASDLVARTQAVAPEHVERIAKEVLPPRLREALDGEGACDFAIDHREHGRFRVNLSKHRGGTTIALRVLGREVPSVRGLALPETIASGTHHTQGLVLVTGPAGHGKSTTLAALVDAINANADVPRHVYTIEDPIEHVHPKRRGMVTQRELGTHVKSWSQAVDDALASDVDVIVIGDLRDEGAMRAALAGCEAGRLVIATLSCTNAARAIDRIVERFPASEQPRTRATLASAVRLIVGQRLVPSADRTKLHVAIEVLPGTSSLYALIRDGRTQQIAALQQRARSLGFVRLDDSLADLVRAQKVTLDVAKQFAESPADLVAAPAKKG